MKNRRFWSKRSVFLSYRRGVGSAFAHLLAAELRMRGFAVTLDVDSEEAGLIEQRLRRSICEADAFVVVLSAGMFPAARDPDWVTWEVQLALTRPELPIVPVMSGGQQMADVKLPAEITALASFQAVTVPEEYRAPAFDRLERMLRNAPLAGDVHERPPAPARRRWPAAAGVAAVAAAVVAAVALVTSVWLASAGRSLRRFEQVRSPMTWQEATEYCQKEHDAKLPRLTDSRDSFPRCDEGRLCLYWTRVEVDGRSGYFHVVDGNTGEKTTGPASATNRVLCGPE